MREFADKELAPYAQTIDQENTFKDMRSFWKKLGEHGLLGVTAPGVVSWKTFRLLSGEGRRCVK